MAGVVADLVDVRSDELGQAVVLLQIDRQVGLGLLADFGQGLGVLRAIDGDADDIGPGIVQQRSPEPTVASMSCVCVAVMLCTAIGWPPPIVTEPMRTERVGLRGMFTVLTIV